VKSNTRTRLDGTGLPRQNQLYLVLSLVITDFAAIGAVVLAVLGQANAKIRMAQGAVFRADAAIFRLIANNTAELFLGHDANASTEWSSDPD
jgi:hypothetical protein